MAGEPQHRGGQTCADRRPGVEPLPWAAAAAA
jgi:hypothetical protein